ncbi:DUF4901 domain-containing protein [Bacillus sp. NSP9.1]|nr:YcdB/YcdC domain-containing protein [Bacillus sp. NSP9.1]QHZ49217.1 DUF4901 domain-containing protein [Bacillus sp. NSP9.1]
MTHLAPKLKQKARHIGAIPENYQLIIEDLDRERAFFVWQDPEHPDNDIAVELDCEGRFISLTKEYAPVAENELPEGELQQIALQFVERHYPSAVASFVFQEKKVTEQAVRYTYAQMALDLPLPQTGFFVDIAKDGEVLRFRYHGGADSVSIPKQLADRQQVISEYLDQVDFELTVEHIRRELYESGDDQPHLIYETRLPFISYPADSSAICEKTTPVDDEEEEETLPLPVLSEADRDVDLHELIGFSPSFRKIREADLGDSIGTVWREGSDPDQEDFGIESYFKIRNHNTLKIKKDKKTGKLKGLFSFIEAEGSPVWTEEACRKRALQFLYLLYPDARQYFRMHPLEKDEEEQKTAAFQFDLTYEGVPLRLGFANIIINRINGLVVGFFAPEIEPETLKDLNPSPAITREEAKDIFASVFDVELEWEEDDHYTLVYRPVYPVFIDAHDGKAYKRNMV